MKIKKYLLALLLGSSAFLMAGTLGAQELPATEMAEVVEAVADAIPFEDGYAAFMETPGAAFFTISNLWLLISAALVFIMHLGFATVESGLSRSKNTVNILFKNVFIINPYNLYFICYTVIYPERWVFCCGKPNRKPPFQGPTNYFDTLCSTRPTLIYLKVVK